MPSFSSYYSEKSATCVSDDALLSRKRHNEISNRVTVFKDNDFQSHPNIEDEGTRGVHNLVNWILCRQTLFTVQAYNIY